MLFRAAQNAALTTLAPLGEADLHLGPAAVGGISALGTAVTVIVTLMVSRRVTTRSIRAALGAGLLLTAAGVLVMGLAGSTGVFVGGAMCLGAGGGLVFPTLITLVGASRPQSPSQLLAALTVVLSVGLAIGPILESVLIRAGGGSLRVPLVVFSLLPFAAGIVILARRSPFQAAAGVSATEPPENHGVAPEAIKVAASVWHRPGWRLATAGQLLYQIPFAVVVVFGVLVARHVYGLSPSSAQLGLTAFYAASMGTRLWLTWRGRTANPRVALLVAAGLTIIGVATFAGGSTVAVYFVALAILGVPHGLTYPISLGLIAEETPGELLAHANASFYGWTSAASVSFPALLGVLGGWVGLRPMLAIILLPVLMMTAIIAASRSRPFAGQ